MNRVSHYLAVLLLPLCFSTAAEDFRNDVEEIHVTARRVQTQASDIVESVTSVSGEEILSKQPQIVTDALIGAPGVFIQQTTPGQGTAIVRGLKGSEILHLVDGMRLNNALFRNAPNQYLALVSPNIVDRVEVVRGPLSAVYGSDAMGGVVQLLTERHEFDTANWQKSGNITAGFDSANLARTADATFAFGRNGISSGASLIWQDFDDVRAAEGRVQTDSGFRARGASAYLRFESDNHRLWDFSFQFQEQPSTPRHDELVAGFGQTEAASEQFQFKPNSRLFFHLEHSGDYGSWLQDATVHVGFQKMRDGRLTQDTGSDNVREEDNRSDLFGLTLQAGSGVRGIHTLTYGIDVYLDDVSSSRVQTSLTTGLAETIQSRFPDGSGMSNIDVFLHDQMQASDRLTLSAGGRISQAKVELSDTESSPGADISNSDVSGSFGGIYRLTEQWQITGNIARGFRAPNIFDLGTLGARPGNRFNIANTDLGPETVLTAEVGLRLSLPSFSLEAVVWESDYDDKIVSVFTGETDDSGRDIVQSQNASSVRLNGFEISGNWDFTDRIRSDLVLNYTRGETTLNDAGTEPADRVPPLNGRLGILYATDSWDSGAEIVFAAEQDRLSARDIRDPRINPDGTAGWGMLNLFTSYQGFSGWVFRLRGENLLDRDFRRHGSGIDAAGRSVKLSLSASF